MTSRLFNGMGYNLLGMFDDVLGFIVHGSFAFPFCFLFRPFSLELGKGIDDDGNDEMNQDSTSMQKIIIILFKSLDNRAGGSCHIYDFSAAMTVNSTYVLLLKVKQIVPA